jgi:hypothetical protein
MIKEISHFYLYFKSFDTIDIFDILDRKPYKFNASIEWR